MSNDYYNPTGNPQTLNRGSSSVIRAEFDLIQSGLDLLPTLIQNFAATSNYAVDTGVVNAYVIAVNAAIVSVAGDGYSFRFKTANANTGASTLNTVSIVRPDGTALQAGDIVAGINTVTYNSTKAKFELSSLSSVVAANNAAASAAAAAASAAAASTSETNAATSETNAANSASLAQSYVNALTSTSTTSLTIGTGAKVFTTQINKGYAAGQFFSAISAANSANYMHGTVTSYVGTTLTVNVTDIGGSGTLSDWNLSVSGSQGSIGPAGPGSVGVVPIGGLIANKNVGTSFTDAGAVWLRTGVIATSATYPSAPTTTINDGATWLTKTGVSISSPAYAANGTGTVLAVSKNTNGTGYAISTDYGATWASATFPASISGIPVWCGTFFLLVNLNQGASTTTFYTSTTGATGTWTARTVASNTYINGVYGAQGCIITTTTTQGYITTDGINYTSITMPVANLSGTYGNNFYIFTTYNGGTPVTTAYKTSTGATFSTKTLPFALQHEGTWDRPIAYGEGVFLYAQNPALANCFTTTDFENFSVSNTGISVSLGYTRTFGNGTFMLCPSGVSSTAYTSDDVGVTWTARTLPSSANWANMVFTGNSFAAFQSSTTNAIQSVSGGTYTDTAKAMFADSPENTRPFYMRVA